MKIIRRSYGIAGKTLFLAMLTDALLFMSGAPAWSQETSWSLGVDLPLQFIFTGDVSGTATPSGYKITLDTPFVVGVGTEKYTVPVDDSDNNIETSLEFSFIDVFIDVFFSVMHGALGFGTGTVAMEDFDFGGSTFSAADDEATQTYIALGWPLSPTWEFHVAYHRVVAESTLESSDATIADIDVDFGGIMHSAGFKFLF